MIDAFTAPAAAAAALAAESLRQPISIFDQIKAVEREIGMRKRVYPAWVKSGKMKLDHAEYQIAAMEAVLATLREVPRV